jgi:hypothetical protein
MKRFLMRACAKVGRFFWSWGFLKFVLGVVVLIILLYVEEDWRGAHAWAVTKAKWEAKGETFDYAKFIPPPVPDPQNLAAIPLFQLKEEKATWGTYLGLPNLEQALREDADTYLEMPPVGNWMLGNAPDMAKIGQTIAEDYGRVFKGQKPPGDILAQFDALFPFTADLRAAAATRPRFRLNMNYAVAPPAIRSFGPVAKMIKLSQVLTLHAVLALDNKQSDLALSDIKTNYIVLSGVKRDPSLVGGLVALGVSAISLGAVYHGLVDHDWNDAQLVELEQIFERINFLEDYQFAMRSEIINSKSNFEFFEHVSRSDLFRTFGTQIAEIPLLKLFEIRWPSGWWDENKRRMADRLFDSLSTVDPQARLIFPKTADDLQDQIKKANEKWDAYVPWKILSSIATGPITNAAPKFAQGQVWVDEARIACALERYRLAHGVYPGSLDALAPAYIDKLPHDIMNGEPYHYQLRPDGTFLLYSVGWNQKDDGGKVIFKTDSPTQVDYEAGDWVWPTPQISH